MSKAKPVYLTLKSLCSEIKTAQHQQLVAFVCNWRVAILTDCPDEILRTEFDPAAFAQGVQRHHPTCPPEGFTESDEIVL